MSSGRERPAATREGMTDVPYELCGRSRTRGFTLLEVMIAMAVFFIVVFAILGVVVQSLGAARALQVRHADASMLAAELSMTNMLEEGFASGDFGELYPDQYWERQITEVGSNGLFQVEWAVYRRGPGEKQVPEILTTLMHRPASVRRR